MPLIMEASKVLDSMKEMEVLLEDKWKMALQTDVKSLMKVNATERDRVVQRLSEQGAPPQFRLIDCKSTSQHKRVMLVDGHDIEFTAVSHTWGQDVYGTFDCECAAECSAKVARCCNTPCPGTDKHVESHSKVISDILKMCNHLMNAGSEFVWHDGVCIAQHDEKEVSETIRHMGWIYAAARDTVIFLDYVGKPRALLQLGEEGVEETRWNTRVWTVQEALLSKRRRYCIRVPGRNSATSVSEHTRKVSNHSSNWLDRWAAFKAKLALLREDDSCIAVVEEEGLWDQYLSLFGELKPILLAAHRSIVRKGRLRDPNLVSSKKLRDVMELIQASVSIQETWYHLFMDHLFRFPSLKEVLQHCATFRDSKHKGDRINSVLGLAGITDGFTADKGKNVEGSTIQFVKRLGQNGIREFLFSDNHDNCAESDEKDGKVHSWLPCLSRSYTSAGNFLALRKNDELDEKVHSWLQTLPAYTGASRDFQPIGEAAPVFDDVKCEVLKNGMLRLKGELHCVCVELALEDHGRSAEERKERLSLDLSLIKTSPIRTYKASLERAKLRSAGSGWVTLPAHRHGSMLEEGGTISAHIVTGSLPTNLHLLVQGNIMGAHPVSKLGHFSPDGLHIVNEIIRRLPQAHTLLHELVIR